MNSTFGPGIAKYTQEENLKAHYAQNPNYYSPISWETVHFLQQKIPAEAFLNVLDLCCGTGWFASWVKNTYHGFVIGVDYCEQRIKIAQSMDNAPVFFHWDVYYYLEWTDTERSLITIFDGLEHLKHPEEIVNRAKELSPLVVATVPIDMPYVAHLQVFPDEQSVEDKFGPTDIERWGRHFFCTWRR